MPASFEAQDPDYQRRLSESFGRQKAMSELGAMLSAVRPGVVEITFPYQERFTQQHGFLHAGIVATVLDSACGYAAFSLMPADAGILSVEFKINLLAPAAGERFVARGEVIRPGRSITVCSGAVRAHSGEEEKTIAAMQATMMAIHDRPGVVG